MCRRREQRQSGIRVWENNGFIEVRRKSVTWSGLVMSDKQFNVQGNTRMEEKMRKQDLRRHKKKWHMGVYAQDETSL
jgi:hypothetical protein